mgnify:CR=1 FL=1
MQLVNVDRVPVLIPSLAIHMNRSVNDGYAYKCSGICSHCMERQRPRI